MSQAKKFLLLLLFPIIVFADGSATKQNIDEVNQTINQSISHMSQKQQQAEQDLQKKESALGQTSLAGMLVTNGKQPGIPNTSTIQTIDRNGNPILLTLKCMDINGVKQCMYIKQQSPTLNVSYSNPPNISIPVKPNNPGNVSNPWISIIATLIYLSLTVYLFIIASSNLFKREILSLIVDLSLWVMLTGAMYFIWINYLL